MPNNFISNGVFWVLGKCKHVYRIQSLIGRSLIGISRLREFDAGSVESISLSHPIWAEKTKGLDRLNNRDSIRGKLASQRNTALQLTPLSASVSAGHDVVKFLSQEGDMNKEYPEADKLAVNVQIHTHTKTDIENSHWCVLTSPFLSI